MTQLMLRPVKDVLDINGSVTYSNAYGAWNTITFRSMLLRKFPQLKTKTNSFGYKMLFYENSNDLKQKVEEIKEKGEALPILLWLYRE